MESEQDSEALSCAIESILLVAGGAVTYSSLASATGSSRDAVERALDALEMRMVGGIRLQRHGGAAQLVSAPECVHAVQAFLGTSKPPALSRAALETLAVIAYREPVTRAEIEAIRGVNSDRALQTLQARDLVEERGQRPVLGRPMQYGTTFGFLEYFGLSSRDDLPALEEQLAAQAEGTLLGFRQIGAEREKAAQSGD